jgi:hypothetical protein
MIIYNCFLVVKFLAASRQPHADGYVWRGGRVVECARLEIE